jgi:Domain of unknown function (DUF4194)
MPAEAFLSSDDQARLNAAMNQLLADGLLWRENEPDRRAYNDLARWPGLASNQLQAKGWHLVHHATAQTFQAVHRKQKHRRHIRHDTAMVLLVCRLLYIETAVLLTPYPVVAVGSIARQCASLGFTPELTAALPELASFKLIRAAAGKTLRPTNPEQMIELLPTLTAAVPDTAIEAMAKQLLSAQNPNPPNTQAQPANSAKTQTPTTPSNA